MVGRSSEIAFTFRNFGCSTSEWWPPRFRRQSRDQQSASPPSCIGGRSIHVCQVIDSSISSTCPMFLVDLAHTASCESCICADCHTLPVCTHLPTVGKYSLFAVMVRGAPVTVLLRAVLIRCCALSGRWTRLLSWTPSSPGLRNFHPQQHAPRLMLEVS